MNLHIGKQLREANANLDHALEIIGGTKFENDREMQFLLAVEARITAALDELDEATTLIVKEVTGR